MLYLDGVKYPLEELYYELYSYFSKLDSDLLSNKRKGISSAYNDARFCSDAPKKEYFYIRFKVDTRGMEKIRDYILDNKHYAKEVIEKFNKAGLLEVRGETIESAVANALDAKRAWLETALEEGIEIYEPDSLEDYSGIQNRSVKAQCHLVNLKIIKLKF